MSANLRRFAAFGVLAVFAASCGTADPVADVGVSDASGDGGGVFDASLDSAQGDAATIDAGAPADATSADAQDASSSLDATTPDAMPEGDGGTPADRCAGPFAPCAPSPGATAFVRIRGTVLTPDVVYCDGEVLYSTDTGRIVCVGPDCGARTEAAGARVVCANGVVLPGLIDPHQHAEYGHLPVFRHPASYDNSNTWKAFDPSRTDYLRAHRPFGAVNRANQVLAQRYAEVRLVLMGGTALSGTAGPLLRATEVVGWARNLDSTDAALSGFVGGLYVDPDFASVLVDARGAVDEPATAAHLSTFLPRMAAPEYRAFLPHLAEGIDVNARLEFDAAQRNGVLTRKTSVVHCTACSTQQLASMAANGVGLVWSPHSNADLYGRTASVTTARSLGVRIALGTDWTPSGSPDLLTELACAAAINETWLDRAFTDAELVAMSTSNAAAVLKLEDRIGRLEPGLEADITVLSGDRQRPYRTVLSAGADQVRLVTVHGQALYGDAELLPGPSPACLDVPSGLAGGSSGVCGVAKRVCTSSGDVGALNSMMTDILTAARNGDSACVGATPAAYCYAFQLMPLFRCGPADLTRCRLGHPAISRRAAAGTTIPAVPGLPAPGSDSDGDGVADAADDCVRVFNPPFDLNTMQDDIDGDGVGDACDSTPCSSRDGGNACLIATLDGGVADGGRDAGPDAATGAELSIPQIRDPSSASRPLAGDRVTVRGAIVVAVKEVGATRAFVIQDRTASRWAGLYVTTPGATGLAVGDLVTVTGTFGVFRGLDLLNTATGGTVTRTGSAAPPAPLVVLPGAIATGGSRALELQSMLLRVDTVTATSATTGTDFRVDPGGLLVTSLIANDTLASPFPATTGQTFSSIVGVLYTFGPSGGPFESKLAPRSAADLTTP